MGIWIYHKFFKVLRFSVQFYQLSLWLVLTLSLFEDLFQSQGQGNKSLSVMLSRCCIISLFFFSLSVGLWCEVGVKFLVFSV